MYDENKNFNKSYYFAKIVLTQFKGKLRKNRTELLRVF